MEQPLTLNVGDLATVTIEKMVYEGWGMGRIEGRTVFVPQAFPGEVLEIRISRFQKRHAFAEIITLKEPSPIRKASPCTHFPACGGCQMMNVGYEDQLKLKYDMLIDCTTHLFPEIAAHIKPVLGSSRSHYYRNKMEFAATTDEKGAVRLGLKARGRFDQIIPTPGCLLQSETGNAIRAFLETLLTEAKVTVWNHHTHQGFLRYVVMRQSKTWDHFLVNLVVSADNKALITEIAQKLREAFPEVVSVFMSINTSPTDTAFNASPILISGESTIEEVFKDKLSFQISPQSFFQTNTAQAKVLYQTVLDRGDFKPTDVVFDLYCGTGTIGLFLAPHVKEVIGIEENPQAIEDAHKNAKNNQIENVKFVTEKVKNFLKFTGIKPSVIVLDPPRSGNVPKALQRIIDMKAPKLVYVSCNPATLCRDLKEMCAAGYRIVDFQPVDMFPNTYHVECVVVLHK